MAIYHLASPDDPHLAPFMNLKRSNTTRWQSTFIAEGDKLTDRVLASDYETVSLLVAGKHLDRYAQLATRAIDLFVVPDELVERIVGFNFHRGVLACARRKANPPLEQVVPQSAAKAVVTVCPDIQDPENLGSILRISAAFGVRGVVLGPESSDFLSRRVLRVSMGAALQLPIRRSDDVAADLKQLRAVHGYELWGTSLDSAALPLSASVRPTCLAVLFGHQGHGLSRELLALCDRNVTIPMQPGVDSLNVAVTAGIVLYKLLRE